MAFLSFGSIYFSTPAETILTADTAIKAAGATTTMQLADFMHTVDNRLTYDDAITRIFEVNFSGSVTKGTGSRSITVSYLYKNGVAIPGAVIGRAVPNASDEGAFAVNCQVSLSSGDYIELWIESDTGDDLTIERGVLSAKVLG